VREHLDGNFLAGVIWQCGKNILLNTLFNLPRVKGCAFGFLTDAAKFI
jgi:hypothetical protein